MAAARDFLGLVVYAVAASVLGRVLVRDRLSLLGSFLVGLAALRGVELLSTPKAGIWSVVTWIGMGALLVGFLPGLIPRRRAEGEPSSATP